MNTKRFSRFAIGLMLGLLFLIDVQAVPVSSTPYFYRTNILRTDGGTMDLLVIGTIVNPVQGTSAVARQGATTEYLLNTTANFLEVARPYNPAELGPWTITVTNGPNTTTSITNDLFGVPPLPFATNLQIHGELMAPLVTWELPVTSVPYTQIRIRVIDFAGGAVVFTSTPLPATATSYVLPNSILQSGRDYVLRVMLEEMRGNNLVNRSDARVTYTTYDGPVAIESSEVFYFRRAVRQAGFADRDEILLVAGSVKPSAGTTVTARSLVDPTINVNLNFTGCGIYPNEFATFSPFNSVPVAVATGGVTITAENGGIQDQVTMQAIGAVQPMPFAENVQISGNPLAPTASWTLPMTAVPFTEIRVRVWESRTNPFCILSSFLSPSLPVTATTYSIPSGVLRGGSDRYLIQVRLSEIRNGVTINRSEVRIPHSTVGVCQPPFNDVPCDHWAWGAIEKILVAGITGGCGNNNYCPLDPVTRAQMAAFLLRGLYGGGYSPPPATGAVFHDVPLDHQFAREIEQLAREEITRGCGGGNYCPNASITRAQMAIFLLRAKHGSTYSPPPATGTRFSDVPLGAFAADWIEQLAAEGITGGCGGGNYCPNAPVNRDQMAVFLVRTFNL